MKAAIYTRLSSDPDGTSTACERQEADARAHAESHGWSVVSTYRDNDVSAFDRRKKRPEFERLLTDLADGEIEVVIVWKSDRLARQPRDLERFLDAAEPRKATLASVTEPQFSGAAGLFILRSMVNFASYESSVKSERLQRKKQELADRGDDAGGPRPFGYKRTEGGLVVDRAEAKEIRAAVKLFLAGTPQVEIADDWNARRVGGRTSWNPTRVLAVLKAPRVAGLRVHRGAIVGSASWKPIISVQEHERVRALADSRRKGKRQSRAPQLLAGLAVCALCDGNLSARADGYYSCSKGGGGCGGVSVRTHYADAEVERQFLAVVANPDVIRRLEIPSTPDTAPLTDELRRAEERVAEIAAEYGAGRLTLDEYRPAADAARVRVETAREALAAAVSGEAVEAPDPDEILRRWEEATVEERRRWLRSLVERVVIRRTTVPSRRGFDTSRVRVGWRFSALYEIAEKFDDVSPEEIAAAEEEYLRLNHEAEAS